MTYEDGPLTPEPENTDLSFQSELLRFVAKHELYGFLYWSDSYLIKFWINCNDVFYWGCADAEDVTSENFAAFRRAIEECMAIDKVIGNIEGCFLFAAQVRKMRPQGAAYPKNQDLWPLFDACGPERTLDHGNPRKPGWKSQLYGAAKVERRVARRNFWIGIVVGILLWRILLTAWAFLSREVVRAVGG